MPAERDPASVMLDGAARRLLSRAYSAPGVWQKTVLADPGLKARQRLAGLGIDPHSRDNESARAGKGLNAKDRWGRALVRALYYQHKWFSPGPGARQWRPEKRTTARETGALRVEIGRRVPSAGVIPPGRQVSIMYDRGGITALRAVRRQPDRDRIYDDAGDTAARWSDPANRDW